MESLTLQAFANASLVDNPLEELGLSEGSENERIWTLSDEEYENALRLKANK